MAAVGREDQVDSQTRRGVGEGVNLIAGGGGDE
jgi:hypothetical protein